MGERLRPSRQAMGAGYLADSKTSSGDAPRAAAVRQRARTRARLPVAGLFSHLTIFIGVPFLGILCLLWSVVALPARAVLPGRIGTALGRWGISRGFRLYVNLLRFFGAYRFDMRALDTLSAQSGVVLAPNHPSLIDALILLAYHPNMACIMKTSLMRNVFLGAGARLAGFIGNTPPRRMITDAVDAVQAGAALLLFPEGTRTRQQPVNAFQLTAGAIAKHAHCPVQTVLIETDSAYLSKGWTLFRVPALPIVYRVRLGRRFAPPTDVRLFTAELEDYFGSELRHSILSSWLPTQDPSGQAAGASAVAPAAVPDPRPHSRPVKQPPDSSQASSPG
jgi:1-acyl-sn-glycerol-3-phosphate acyltransferase